MSGDLYFDNVELLMHMDGANNSTLFTDNSPTTKTISRVGLPVISTTQSKFGGASAKFNGSNSWLSVSNSSAFNLGSLDFTIEAWIRPNVITSDYGGIFSKRNSNDEQSFTFFLSGDRSGAVGFLLTTSTGAFKYTLGSVPPVNQWSHVAAVRSGSMLRVYVNGVGGTATNIGTVAILDTNIDASIGILSRHIGYVFDGYIDELRVTKGIARYTSNFTVPTEAFPNSKLVKNTKVSTGVGKSFLFKDEGSWGVVPSKTDAINLRRTNAVFDVVTELYTSNEILGSNQIRQVKHGLRNAKGSIKAELSAGTYAKLIANTIASSYSHDVDILDLSIKIEQNLADSSTYDITRQLGSWVVDGFTAGTVVKLDGPLLNINNKLNNLYICSLTETVLTVYPLNAVELTKQPNFVYPNRCYTVGAIAYAKKTDQIDKSFSFEERDHRLGISELYSGNKVKAFEVNTDVKSGLPTIDFELLGRDLVRKEPTEYFDDAPYSTTQVVSPVCTKAFIDNSMVGVMTGLTLRAERELQPNHIIGSKQSIAISESMLKVNGSFTVYFKDASLKQRYYNETTCSLTVVFADSLAKDAQVISFCLPRVVLKSKRKNDNANMLYDTYEFTAILNNSDLNYLLTTIAIQDSAAAIDPDIPIEKVYPFFSIGSTQPYVSASIGFQIGSNQYYATTSIGFQIGSTQI